MADRLLVDVAVVYLGRLAGPTEPDYISTKVIASQAPRRTLYKNFNLPLTFARLTENP